MQMKLSIVFFISVLFLEINVFGQTRTINGRVIDEYSQNIPCVNILYSDSILLATTDINGNFKLELPKGIETLIFKSQACCFESKTIRLTDNCYHLDIILMFYGHYDFISTRKENKLRKKRFNKLTVIHKNAFEKGIFSTEKPCYEFEFVSIKKK
jgi:hypothetical protein